MFGKPNIEPVRPQERSEAIRFVVAGEGRGSLSDARAQAFEAMILARGDSGISLLVARSWRKLAGAALVMENPGRIGFLFYSPMQAPGVNREIMPALVQTVARQAVEGGLSLVQSLVLPNATDDAGMLLEAGFELLADLVYLRGDACREMVPAAEDGVTWRCWGEFDDEELSRVIVSTYEGSLDCPKLAGLRKPAEILASHRASGIFSPSSWWIASYDGRPAGCILVNEAGTGDAMEITYVGVVPAFRGRGLARRMLQKAFGESRQRGFSAITLAVDAGNTYARKVYDELGFRFYDRRMAYAMLRPQRSG